MPYYRRASLSGGTFFFTAVTYRRRPILSRQAGRLFEKPSSKFFNATPFQLMPGSFTRNILHCIWTLPKGDSDFSMRWGLIKSGFSKRAKDLFHIEEWMNYSKHKHRESTIWQRRFWEHQIRNDDEYRAYMDYIHYNPVKHGHVAKAVDWRYYLSLICQIGCLRRTSGRWKR